MRKDHLTAAAKIAFLAFLTSMLFFCLVSVCYDVTGIYLELSVCLTLSLLPALLGGILGWQHQRIRRLERQMDWLMGRQEHQ